MKFKKIPEAKIRSDDSKSMIEAIHRLDELRIDVRRPTNSPYQLKVTEEINYFPSKGTIHIDGELTKRDENGLEALIQLLDEKGDIPLSHDTFIDID